MTVRGYQTWLTFDKNVSCATFVPFCLGGGVRHEVRHDIGIFDIVVCGFGLTFEWIKKPKGGISDRSAARIER